MINRRPLALPCAALILSASIAAAQPVDTADAIPTVVVSARQVDEQVQDVPISMVVLDGETMAAAGASQITSLPERVPGMTVMAANPRLTSFSIRGLGSNGYSDSVESSVGLFIDGIYVGRPSFAVFDLIDLERIEVLRGAQGTLSGKNTTAGAIHIHTRLPAWQREAELQAIAGDYDTRQLRGSVSGPLLADRLAARLTGYYSGREGLITNLYDGGTLNNRNRYGFRGQMLWQPTPTLSGRLIGEYGNIDERCCVYPLVSPFRAAVVARDEYMEYTRVSGDPADRVTDSDGQTRSRVEQQGLSAEWNWQAGGPYRLVSLSAWRDWRFDPKNDDATSLKLVSVGTRNTESLLSQELRLHADFDGFSSVAGLYYLHRRVHGAEINRLEEDIAAWTFGGLIRERLPFATRSNSGFLIDALIPPQTLDGMTGTLDYWQQTDSAAAYGAVRMPLGEDFELSAGLRYTQEWKRAHMIATRSGGNPDASVLSQTNNLALLGGLIGQDFSAYTFDGLLDSVGGKPFERRDSRDEGNASAQLALRYALDAERQLYVSAARGYKSGGINLGVTGETVAPQFKPEIVSGVEAGLKGTFAQRRLALELASYYTDVRDYQALTFDGDAGVLPNPRLINLLNVGRVRLYGVELQLQGAPLSGLAARLGLAWNHAVTVDFDNAPDETTRQNTKDLSGEQLYNAPRWTGTAGLEYGWRRAARHQPYAAIDYSFRSGTYGTAEHGATSYIDGYQLTDLRAGLRDALGHWDLSVFVRNLFDEGYIAAVQPLYGVGDYGAFAGDPRIVGINLRVRL